MKAILLDTRLFYRKSLEQQMLIFKGRNYWLHGVLHNPPGNSIVQSGDRYGRSPLPEVHSACQVSSSSCFNVDLGLVVVEDIGGRWTSRVDEVITKVSFITVLIDTRLRIWITNK